MVKCKNKEDQAGKQELKWKRTIQKDGRPVDHEGLQVLRVSAGRERQVGPREGASSCAGCWSRTLSGASVTEATAFQFICVCGRDSERPPPLLPVESLAAAAGTDLAPRGQCWLPIPSFPRGGHRRSISSAAHSEVISEKNCKISLNS